MNVLLGCAACSNSCCPRTVHGSPAWCGCGGGRVAEHSPGGADPGKLEGWDVCSLAEFGDTAVSKLSLLFSVLLPGGKHWKTGCPDGALAATGPAQALFSPCPVGEKGISLMQNKESYPSLFLAMHFSVNNEVSNIEYLLNVLWWWLRGAAAAWLHEQVQRFCWLLSRDSEDHRICCFWVRSVSCLLLGRGWLALLLLDCLLLVPQQMLCICLVCKY